MEKTIGVTQKTKQLFDRLAVGWHHDAFVNRLLHLWQATPAYEREKKLERFNLTQDEADLRDTQEDVRYGGTW